MISGYQEPRGNPLRPPRHQDARSTKHTATQGTAQNPNPCPMVPTAPLFVFLNHQDLKKRGKRIKRYSAVQQNSGIWESTPAPRKQYCNKKVFNPFLNKYLFSPSRCGWDEGRVYFPVKCFDPPP